jgi:hypothetical protein
MPDFRLSARRRHDADFLTRAHLTRSLARYRARKPLVAGSTIGRTSLFRGDRGAGLGERRLASLLIAPRVGFARTF